MTHLFVSVIIPVYNDGDRLRTCLGLLENQTYPKSAYEVVVVDNNSTEDLKGIVASFAQARYAFEASPGSYNARNTGIALAKGDILAFTDSDCSPAPDWIEKGVDQMLRHKGCGLVAGRINFSFKDPQSPTPAELYDSLHFLQQEKYIKSFHFGVTANLFTTPEIFEAVGLFNPALKSGGDREWGQRVYAAGYEQVYAEDVEICHPARSELKELSQKLRRVYEGEFYIKNQLELPPIKFLGVVLADLKPPASHLIQILRNSNIRNVGKRILVVYIYLYLKLAKALVNVRLYWNNA
ncbi:glycosyltransferase [Nodosilinea nodulosa]|uniref:glycosyltransferase n=1 Tax=Nodosilinea nodulosa TaxID=416001 RepID=UPI00031A921D|nr:glycosyltransferase family A protein [Nodosilinea nodulosa]